MRNSGNSRTFLLVALATAVVVVVAGGWYLVASDGSHGGGSDAGNEGTDDGTEAGGPERLPPGAEHPGRKRRPNAGQAGEEPGDEDDLLDPGADRDPEGPSFEITPETMRHLLDANEWEELRRQIDVFQQDGKPVPPELVAALFDLLRSEGHRLDAVLALGLVRDDATGALLANAAADATLPEEVRLAALQALAKSGQSAALAPVRKLVEDAGTDTPFLRQALRTLGAIGGPEGVGALLVQLDAHPDDDLSGAVLAALAKSRGGDATLASALRTARLAGDIQHVDLLLKVGTQMGAASGAELRREVRALVESPAALAESGDGQEARERRETMRYSAIYVSAAMGGDQLDPLIELVRSDTGALRSVSLQALWQHARGDDAAKRILTLFTPDMDPTVRYSATVSLGATGSREGTKTVHALLDDADGAVREAASAAMTQIRDPASIPVALSGLDRIDRAKGSRAAADTTVARNLINVLGATGAKEALPKLKALLESPDPLWKEQEYNLRQAIRRIESGDPDSTRVR